MESPLPIVDFTEGSLDKSADELEISNLSKIGRLLCNAFQEFGAVYLKNTGIKQKHVSLSDPIVNHYPNFFLP